MTQAMPKLIQAKHVTDETMLALLAETRGRHGVSRWSTWWDVRDAAPGIPWKVIRAKLRSMVKRRMIDGCTCGCRGDFELREF